MFKWLGGLIDRFFAVIGAIFFAQVPLFMQQYSQQLIGRTAELRFQVDAMRQIANTSGKTLGQLMQKFLENSDADVALQGEIMLTMVNRWHHLSEALAAMQESSIWTRPFVFLTHLDNDVFFSTFEQFKIGLPLTPEGGVYALVGIVLGYSIFSVLKYTEYKIYRFFLPPYEQTS